MTAAIALRLTGASVSVFDANIPPIDKACGEGLLPDTLEAFRELGVQIPAQAGYRFHGVKFLHARSQAQAAFPHGHAIGIRRTILHELLLDRARALGVDLQWGIKAVYLPTGVLAAQNKSYKPKLIVGADGQKSNVRASAGLDTVSRENRRYGFRRHYALAPWSDCVEVYWSKRCQIYVTPVSPNQIGVALLTGDPRQRLNQALPLFPALAARLQNAPGVSLERGGVTGLRKLKSVYRNGVALVGDASGSIDAITGEGIGLAVRQSLALAKAFESGRLESYARAHRAIRRRPAMMAQLMLLLSRHESLQRPAISCLAMPGLFDRLLAMHVGPIKCCAPAC